MMNFGGPNHMEVFLTGATGYIGSAVAEALKKAGHKVTGLARTEEKASGLIRAACVPSSAICSTRKLSRWRRGQPKA
jgi:nucleoside-diphosphate-sugar epimerase